MKDHKGREHYERQSIADIFADFYGRLYASRNPSGSWVPSKPDAEILKISHQEVKAAISDMKSGRAQDGMGVLAEMIKSCGEFIVDVLTDLYNQVISIDAVLPGIWKKTTLIVIHKAGDQSRPEKYRPTSIIPVLYKLFSKLLYMRLAPILDRQQSKDQAGFRPRFSTVHHLSVVTLLQEKAYEIQIPVWIAALDFKKAFDSVEHISLWRALQKQAVPEGYINLLSRLYFWTRRTGPY